MRLLFNAAYDTRNNDGITNYIRCLTSELAKMCEVTVLTPDPELFAAGCATIRIPGWTRSQSGRIVWTNTLLLRYCRSPFSVVFTPTPVAPLGTRIPSVSVVHDLTPLAARHVTPSRQKFAFWASLQTLRRADFVVTDSAHTLTDLGRLHLVRPSTRKVVNVGPGLSPSTDEGVLAERYAPYVLYVGGYGRNKNVAGLVRAFARVHAAENLHLLIVGWGETRSADGCRRVAQSLGLGDRVVLLSNRLSGTELSGLYRGCLGFVYPSLYEGFGLPVLEALAHGAPTGCSSASSLPEVGGDAAIYFNPCSVSDMACALSALLQDQSLREELRRRGPERARLFSWEAAARAILDVCRDAVGRRSSSG